MIEYSTISDRGEKENNEDAVRVFVNQPLATYGFILADGLGGHGNGDVASNFVADCVGAAIENTRIYGYYGISRIPFSCPNAMIAILSSEITLPVAVI